MSMSTHVMGLRDANDPHHVKMVAALEACLAVPLPLPAPLLEYFDGTSNPDAALKVEVPFKKSNTDSQNHYDVVVSEIPAHVKVIRFTNSW